MSDEVMSLGLPGVGALTAGTLSGAAYVSGQTFDGTGKLTQRVQGSGANAYTRTYAYDAATQRLTRLTETVAGTNVRDEAYSYDLVGNLLTAVDGLGRARCNSYDSWDRLTRAYTTASDCAAGTASTPGAVGGYDQGWTYNTTGD
ncbi:MAG: hypothetical protein ACTHMW_06860, partial [Actinomycetes bacterium]